MATEHEYWREQSDIYALGALDGRELEDFEAHLSTDCEICRAYLRETHETLNLLHRSLQPGKPPAAVKSRVLQRIGREKVVPVTAAKAKEPRRWIRVVGAIAAGIVGIVLTGIYYNHRY